MTAGSVMAYYGSKHSFAAQIVGLMPSHRGYVEPFAGSLSVLMAKAPAPFECVNDLDGDLMTFWRVLRDHPQDLERVCALTPHSRAEYKACWPIVDEVSDLERARRVWVKLSQGRGGQLRPTGWRYHEVTRGRGSGMPVTLKGYTDRFAAAAERMRGVSLECLDAHDLIRRYGRDPQTLIYADPPYLGSTRSRTGYTHEMTRADQHVELAEVLHECEATVMLSGYPSALYDDLYASWHRHEIRAYTGQANSGDGERVEVIWSNRALTHGHIDFGSMA
jgi:DNA adenine methylase